MANIFYSLEYHEIKKNMLINTVFQLCHFHRIFDQDIEANMSIGTLLITLFYQITHFPFTE